MLTVFKPAQKAQNANTEQIRGLLDILKLKFERDAQKFPAALQWKSEIGMTHVNLACRSLPLTRM